MLLVGVILMTFTGCASYSRGNVTDNELSSSVHCQNYNACTQTNTPDETACDKNAQLCASALSTNLSRICRVNKKYDALGDMTTILCSSSNTPPKTPKTPDTPPSTPSTPSSPENTTPTVPSVSLEETPSTSTTATTTHSGLVTSSNGSSCSASKFTGLAASLGYAYSETEGSGSSGSGNTAQLSIGYNTAVACLDAAGTSLAATIGLNLAQTIGSMGTSTDTQTVDGGPPTYDHDCFCFVSGKTTSKDKTEIKNTTALTVQPGVVIGENTQIYLNVGAVITEKNGSSATGSRVGLGVCQNITDFISACFEGNHDQVSGTSINSAGIGVKTSL